MAMNLRDVFDFINFIINKEQSGKYISAREFSLLLQHASLKYFKRYFDVPEEYQVGQPLSRIQWELTTTAKKKLTRFFKSASVTITNSQANYPSDIFYVDYFTTSTGVGRILKGYQFDSIKNNPITMPTEKRAIATLRDNHIEFAPSSLSSVMLHYLAYPDTPNYMTYVDTNDNEVYLPPGQMSPADGTPANTLSTSVELDWDIESVWDIIQIILEDVGIGVDRADVIQYANTKQIKGV